MPMENLKEEIVLLLMRMFDMLTVFLNTVFSKMKNWREKKSEILPPCNIIGSHFPLKHKYLSRFDHAVIIRFLRV